jgi:hypothetical protein
MIYVPGAVYVWMCVPETRSDQILKILPFKAAAWLRELEEVRDSEDKGWDTARSWDKVKAVSAEERDWAAEEVKEEARGRERQAVPAAAEGWEMVWAMVGDGGKTMKGGRIKILILLYKVYNMLQ